MGLLLLIPLWNHMFLLLIPLWNQTVSPALTLRVTTEKTKNICRGSGSGSTAATTPTVRKGLSYTWAHRADSLAEVSINMLHQHY